MKLYHNPRCSKSREALALLQEHGHAPEVVEYLVHPLSLKELQQIQKLLGVSAREMMRVKEPEFKDMGLTDKSDEKTLLNAMVQCPKLIERPILVVHNKKAVIGRPPEKVLTIL